MNNVGYLQSYNQYRQEVQASPICPKRVYTTKRVFIVKEDTLYCCKTLFGRTLGTHHYTQQEAEAYAKSLGYEPVKG